MNPKPSVLIIDDVKMTHDAVKARLSTDALTLHSAFDGVQGLSLAKSIHPDIILLDVEMPWPDGFEVCRQLKSDPALSSIPVIFLTVMSSTDQKVRGLNLGAIDYVTKPFNADELQARIRAALRHKELHDILAEKAMIDGLTGLWNRGYLEQRLKEELAHAVRHDRVMSCIMLDIDHFKSVNDAHGHGIGDEVLRGIARVIKQVVRSEDIPTRYGGDEFAILLRETDAAEAFLVADRLRAIVEATTHTRGTVSVSATCSLGVADSIPGGETMIDRADRALYLSKQAGRNRVTLFQPSATPLIGATP